MITPEIDRLLDLRNSVSVDISCYQNEEVKAALKDVIYQIDNKLRETTDGQ